MSKPNKKTTPVTDSNADETVAADPTMSVADACRFLGVDPKNGRSKLRKKGWSANGGHYPRLTPGTSEFDTFADIVTSAGAPKA